MIDDRIEEGLSECEAVSQIGSIDDIVAQIRSEGAAPVRYTERAFFNKKLSGWEIAVIIIGFPVWLPLLLAFGAIILSVYAVFWALIVTMWAVEIPFFAIGLISKYLFVGCKRATLFALTATKKSALFLRGKGKNG